MRRLIIFALFALAITACSPSGPAATTTPTVPPLVGSVDIEFPQDGTIVYAETLTISGTAQGLPAEGFKLRLLDTEENVIAETSIVPQGENWQTEIVHGYTGDPSEIVIFALPTNAQTPGDYDVASIVMASLDKRPQGVYGAIFSPLEADEIGGDSVQVSGMASGAFENTVILVLENEGGIVSQQIITLFNPNFVDEVPWATDLAINGATGAATIRLYVINPQDGTELTLAQIQITIGGAAG